MQRAPLPSTLAATALLAMAKTHALSETQTKQLARAFAQQDAMVVNAIVVSERDVEEGYPDEDWRLVFEFHCMGRMVAHFEFPHPYLVPVTRWRILETRQAFPDGHDPRLPDEIVIMGDDAAQRGICGILGPDGLLDEVHFETLDEEGGVVAWVVAPAEAVAKAVTSMIERARAHGLRFAGDGRMQNAG